MRYCMVAIFCVPFMYFMAMDAVARSKCGVNDAAVIQAVANAEGARVKKGDYIILYQETVRPAADRVLSSEFNGHQIMVSLLESREGYLMSNIVSAPGVRYVKTTEMKRIFSDRKLRGFDSWKAFYAAFPAATGIINVSFPGYSKDQCSALVYLELQRGYLSAEDVFVEAVFTHDKWSVIARRVVFSS